MTIQLTEVLPDDIAELHDMLVQLGISDGVAQIRTTPQSLQDSLFGPEPAAFARFVRYGDAVAGFIIYSWKWGTFTGARDMYLHALYVRPEFRRKRIAQAAMAGLARIALDSGGTRIEWLTVKGKEMSRAFYEAIGSREADHMTVRRIQGDALQALARQSTLTQSH